MIAGLFLRNYKIYEKYNYLTFTNGEDEKFNLFIGNNGAGKSSVLEAFDTFFNGREFPVHTNARDRDASIAPVFLIKKENINPFLTSSGHQEFVERFSDFLWHEDFSSLYGSNPSMQGFVSARDNYLSKGLRNEYYLLVIGYEKQKRDCTVIGMDPKAKSLFNDNFSVDEELFRSFLNKTYSVLLKYYKYIYIPVETSISDFLKLEAEGMQALMNQDLKSEIENILKHEFSTPGTGTQRQTTRQIKIVSYINEKISEYVDSIETKIQSIDREYHFNRELRSKTVSAKDFASVIIDAYFSKRNLQNNGKNIANLSAGERKKALVDIAYAFLSADQNTDQEIIFGIDEPESSLHISMCFDQFQRLEEIANKFGKQLFVTTHWYGSLPILNNGRLYSISKAVDGLRQIDTFSLENYFEQRKDHPDDINLKSFYDLTASIISSVRNNGDKWLIVEGLADKRYLEHYLPTDHGYKILPVGGCSIVKKIYEYLYLPLSQDEETASGSGKIFCLIDTDAKSESLSIPSTTKNKMLAMRRLQIDQNEIKLFKLEQGLMTVNTETEFEETLNPQKFYNSLKKVVDFAGSSFLTSDATENIKDVFDCYELDAETKFSFIKGENTFLKAKLFNGFALHLAALW